MFDLIYFRISSKIDIFHHYTHEIYNQVFISVGKKQFHDLNESCLEAKAASSKDSTWRNAYIGLLTAGQ